MRLGLFDCLPYIKLQMFLLNIKFQIKSRVNDSNWRFGYYGDKPRGTFNDIVTERSANV